MDRPRGVTAALLAAATAVLVVLPPAVSGADSHEDPEQEFAEATDELEHATERERDALRRYNEATDALPAAEDRLREAEQDVARARDAADAAADREEAAAEQLAAARMRHGRLAAELAGTQQRIDRIIAAAYKGRGIYALNSVVASGDPADLLTRLGMLDQLAAGERQALAEFAAAKQEADRALQQAEQARQQAADARESTEQALAAARAAEDEAQQAADEVEELIADRADALAVAREERKQAEAEKERVEAELRAWEEANQDGAPQLNGDDPLLMPVDGVKTSDYGWRYHPVYEEPRLHSGTDFAAPGGTPIWAAADGTVMQAGWNGGYGYFTCLSHGTVDGQGVATCYAHQSEILVSVDQTVQAGDVIGRVGTTGTSTGDHLHFEVRLDGSPVDPLPWLPDCLC